MPARCWRSSPVRGGEVAWAKGGAAYLAMVSGAPIVPVAILGTREPGQRKNQSTPLAEADPPGLRRAILSVPRSSWPRRKAAVAVDRGRPGRLADHVVAAQALTGLPLPGPPKIKSALSTV